MHYYAKSDKNTYIPVRLESISPTGQYFVVRYLESRERICLFKTVRKTNDEIYGIEIEIYHNYSDTERGFQKVIWYEEYGFVKLVFHIWRTFDTESVRLYFDRDLYEEKKFHK